MITQPAALLSGFSKRNAVFGKTFTKQIQIKCCGD